MSRPRLLSPRWMITLALALAACGGDAASPVTAETSTSSSPDSTTVTQTGSDSTYAVYQSAEDIASIIGAAGLGCTDVEVASIVEVADVPGLVAEVDCSQFEGPAAGEELIVLVFDSEASRLSFVGVVTGYGCMALDPPPTTLAYAYGPNWSVLGGYGESPLEFMNEIASELQGEATATDCEYLFEHVDELAGGDDDFDWGDVEPTQWKEALGEIELPPVAPELLPQVAQSPPGVGVGDASPTAVAVSGGAMVAFGEGEVYVWTPPDLSTWRRVALVDASGDSIYVSVITPSSSGFVAFTSSWWSSPQLALSSADGTDWQQQALPLGWEIQGVADGPAGLVAVGSEQMTAPAMWFSADGQSWQAFSPGDPRGTPVDPEVDSGAAAPIDVGPDTVAGGAFGYVVVNNHGTPDEGEAASTAWFSADLVDWTPVDALSGGVRSMAVLDGRFIALVGSDASEYGIWYSDDGLTWVEAAWDDEADFPDWIAAGDRSLLAGSMYGGLARSDEGRVWVPIPDPSGLEDSMFGAIDVAVFAAGQFYGFAENDDFESWSLWVSTDGTAWTRVGNAG